LTFASANIFTDLWGKFTGKVINAPSVSGNAVINYSQECVECPAPREGCDYSGASCLSCGTLVCDGDGLGKVDGSSGGNTSGHWTGWYDKDNPSGSGDYEMLGSQIDKNVCSGLNITKIECETTDGVPLSETGQVAGCTIQNGFSCGNKNNLPKGCLDYQVRFYCGNVSTVPPGKGTGCINDEKCSSISLATLKQNYSVGEQINLTDPPEENIKRINKNIGGKGLTFPNRKIVSNETPKHSGYIIEFEDEPLVKKEVELRKNAKENEKSFWAGIPIIRNFLTLPENVPEKTKSYFEELKRKHENIKEGILNEVNQRRSITGNVISGQSKKLEVEAEFTKVFNGISLNVTDKEAETLKNVEGVKRVYPNYESHINLMDSVPLIGADKVWKLDKNLNNCSSSGEECLTGKGVTIGIIDSGVDYTHPDLGNCTKNQFLSGQCSKFVGGYDFVNNDNDPMDDMGHGTHVAATAAGNGDWNHDGTVESGEGLNGVAPGASIYVYKVANSEGGLDSDDVISGIERSVDPNQDGNFSDHLDVISMSLGFSGNPDDPRSQAVDNVVEAGVVAVIAAGNDGPFQSTIGSPGTAREAITVGASDKLDKIAHFSSRGPVVWNDEGGNENIISKPDITAPGRHICAAQSSEDTIWNKYHDAGEDIHCLDNKHISISGTSMATPHVAGTVALIKQKHPDWTPEEIKSSLKGTAIPLGENFTTQGAGRIDVNSAIRLNKSFPLSSLSSSDDGVSLKIFGTAKGDNLKNYSLYLNGQEVYSSDSPINEKIIYNSDLKNLKDGINEFKLKVLSNDRKTSDDFLSINVENIKNISLLYNDIYGIGELLPIKADVSYDNYNYSILYSKQGGEEWTDKGVIKKKEGNLIAELNTSLLSRGFYNFKFIFNVSGVGVFEKKVNNVYFDPTLKKGWPQRVKDDSYCYIEDNINSCQDYWFGMLEPVVADLDGDGKKEIILYKAGFPSKIIVYNFDGSIKWSSEVGTQETPGWSLNPPVVGDLNNDGRLEILAINPNLEPEGNSELYAFNYDGSILWNSEIPLGLSPTMILADLNRDGNKEVIVKGDKAIETGMGKITIVSNSGEVMNSWSWGGSSWNSIFGTPAVGNFDNDSELEIVVSGLAKGAGLTGDGGNSVNGDNTGIIYVYNMDGSVLEGWPKYTNGTIFSSPVVGDINNDGYDEIVVGLMSGLNVPISNFSKGGVYVFNRKGKILPGWPVEQDWDFLSTPALGDINKDGYLEISISNSERSTYLFNYKGEILPGWPQKTAWKDYSSSIISDVNGDNNLDILTTAGGIRSCPDNCGGVYAWD